MQLLKNIQQRYRLANMVEKFIYINVAIFLFIFVFNTLGYLFQNNSNFLVHWLSLPATFDGFITKPWTLITYGFVHVGFLHILTNLIALFFIGNLFVQYFTEKQFVTFYILGTVFGGLIFLIGYNYFPVFANSLSSSYLLGASAGVSAIFVGIATYMPNYQLKIPLIGFVKLWYLAAIWVALDVIQIPAGNAGGHLAHLGGALFGFIYVSRASNTEIVIWQKIVAFFTSKKKPLKTVHRTKKRSNQKKTASPNQEQINHILEKISKSGYDTLTKEEKEFLFKQSN